MLCHATGLLLSPATASAALHCPLASRLLSGLPMLLLWYVLQRPEPRCESQAHSYVCQVHAQVCCVAAAASKVDIYAMQELCGAGRLHC